MHLVALFVKTAVKIQQNTYPAFPRADNFIILIVFAPSVPELPTDLYIPIACY